MKFTFAASLITAFACAQEPVPATPLDTEGLVYEEPTPAEKFASMFEQNEEGRWQLRMPDLPKISWADVDDQEITEWFKSKSDLQTAQGQKWADAWNAYETAVAQPWNDFVTRAEELSVEDANLDMQTDEEIVRFVAENTFVDGSSLFESYPLEIENWITEMKAQANWDEFFNFDFIRAPIDAPPTEAPIATPSVVLVSEVAMSEIKGKTIQYGYQPAILKAWFESEGATWVDLKDQVDQQALENIANLENWFNDFFALEEMSFVPEEEVPMIHREELEEIPAPEMSVTFATKAVTHSKSGASYAGYGVMSLGAAVCGAVYLYKKRQQQGKAAVPTTVDNSSLLDDDEEFVMV